ncbi:MAG TPA: hypothetical protein VF407_14665, partial [Polyangiaceae bacterium]
VDRAHFLGRHAVPGIDDLDQRAFLERYDDLAAVAVLDRVADEIADRRANDVRRCEDFARLQPIETDRERLLVEQRSMIVNDRLQHFDERDAFAQRFQARRVFRENEKHGGQRFDVGRGRANAFELMARRRGEHRIGKTVLRRARDHRDRRAKLVARRVDERPLPFDELRVSLQEVVERVDDDENLGACTRRSRQPIGMILRTKPADRTRQRAHGRDEPIDAPEGKQRQHGDEAQRQRGNEVAERLLATFECVDREREGDPLVGKIPDQHDALATFDDDIVMHAGIERLERFGKMGPRRIKLERLGGRCRRLGFGAASLEDVVELDR